MKNDNKVHQELTERGFIGNDDVWIRDAWTVRFFGNEMEIFDDPEKCITHKYYVGAADYQRLVEILDFIDEL